MNAIGYFRQASGPNPESIGRQNRRFLDYCEAQGYEVVATFSEEGKDGTPKAFGQMLEFLRRPEKGFIITVVPSTTTLADEPTVAAARCLQIERHGAQVQFIDEGAGGDALSAILANWSGGQDEEMREKVRSALRRKAVRGEVLGRPPYGYRVGPRNRLDLVEEEAVVVRYIFTLYLKEGLGIRLIARRLNEEGLLTRRKRPWSMVTIRDILRNRAYLGTYQRLGVRVPGTHPALVTPEDFRSVQERLSERRTNYSPRNVSGFLLSGVLRCGHCGNRMIGVSRKQAWTRRRDGTQQSASYRYYQCESRTNQGICTYNTHRAEDVEEAVRERLAEVDPDELATAVDDRAVSAYWQSEVRRLQDRLQQIDRRFSKSIGEAASDKPSRERLRAEGLLVADERLKVEEELRDAEWRAEHYVSTAERRRTRSAALELVVSRWGELELAEKQQLLRELVDHVRVGNGATEVVLRP
jgi:site-specific DNA recombinase